MSDITDKKIIIDDKVITEMINKINSIRNSVEDEFNKINSVMNQVQSMWSDESSTAMQEQFASKKSELPTHIEELEGCKKELQNRLSRYDQEFINKNMKELNEVGK